MDGRCVACVDVKLHSVLGGGMIEVRDEEICKLLAQDVGEVVEGGGGQPCYEWQRVSDLWRDARVV